MTTFSVEPCGVAHTPYKKEGDGPIQGILRPGIEARLELYPSYETCLDGLEGYSHLVVLFAFDQIPPDERKFRVTPYLRDIEVGAFASCTPHRPSGIGIDVVRLISREGNVLVVAEIDMLDGTPLLDIRPYIPRFHHRSEATVGWIEGQIPERR